MKTYLISATLKNFSRVKFTLEKNAIKPPYLSNFLSFIANEDNSFHYFQSLYLILLSYEFPVFCQPAEKTMFFKNISNGSTVHHFTSFLLIVVLDRIYRIHKIRLRAFPAILLILLILSKKLIQLLQLLRKNARCSSRLTR